MSGQFHVAIQIACAQMQTGFSWRGPATGGVSHWCIVLAGRTSTDRAVW